MPGCFCHRWSCINWHVNYFLFLLTIIINSIIIYDFHLNLKAICGEGTKLNSAKETCEPCSIGFYKNVSAKDTSLNKTDRFECKKCPGNLTTYSTKSTEISDCIGMGCIFFIIKYCFFQYVFFYGLLHKYEKKQLFYVIAFFLSVKFYSWLLLEHCEPGYYLSNNTCLPCEIGTYKNTSSHDVTLDKMLRWNCSACEGQSTTISKNSTTCISKLDIIIDFCFQNLLHICCN